MAAGTNGHKCSSRAIFVLQGKTRKWYSEGLRFIMIEGLGPRKGQTDADQIRNFGERLFAQTRGRSRSLPRTWMEAFQKLGERIPAKERTLVLLDEISWMGRHNPDFPGLLKNGWDDYLKVHNNLILAVCCSVSAWIRENLLDSATFGGRFSRDIVLRELPLDMCARFWVAMSGLYTFLL